MSADLFNPKRDVCDDFLAAVHRSISGGCLYLKHTIVNGEPCLQILDRKRLPGERAHVSLLNADGSETILRHADFRSADEFADAVISAMASVFVQVKP